MNPFKKEGQILPIASINSIYVGDKLASDLFRSELLLNEIQQNRDLLGFSSGVKINNMLIEFDYALNSKVEIINEKANEIAQKHGKKLADVIFTLKSPSSKSKENNIKWTSEHWDYWKSIKKIFFVGGLTTPNLTKIFLNQINDELRKKNILDLSIAFIQNSINLGTEGLSTIVENGEYLIFDFGQTNIKRRYLVKKNTNIVTNEILDPIESKFLIHHNKSLDELQSLATNLDRYIIKTISDTIKEVKFKSEYILIGIANYVYNGEVYLARGGYGKLAYISKNYEDYLGKQLSWTLKRNIKVKVIHDTSAMALTFKNEPNAAVISIGTAFGIAFP